MARSPVKPGDRCGAKEPLNGILRWANYPYNPVAVLLPSLRQLLCDLLPLLPLSFDDAANCIRAGSFVAQQGPHDGVEKPNERPVRRAPRGSGSRELAAKTIGPDAKHAPIKPSPGFITSTPNAVREPAKILYPVPNLFVVLF